MFKDYNRTFFDEVSSTMQTIKGTSSPALHIAKSQTKGIGQYGRTWVSQPEKGIYLSLRNHVTMSDEKNLLGMAQLGALVMAETLKTFDIMALLKWPNDLFLNDKKLGGVIVELVEFSNKQCEYILGLGLNLDAPSSVEHAIGLNELSARKINTDDLIKAFVDRWDSAVVMFAKDGLAPFQSLWQSCDYLSDKVVAIKSDKQVVVGQSKGINVLGELILETDQGERLSFNHQASIINID